jgi:hypothetical protein
VYKKMSSDANFLINMATSHSADTDRAENIPRPHKVHWLRGSSTGCAKTATFIDVTVEFRREKDDKDRKCTADG